MYIISTHISVRRRTKTLFLHSRIKKYFNSRLREETNRMISFALCHICHFNSRLLSETNFYRVWLVQKRCNFKSRFLEETNGFLLSGVLCQRISTHVSVRRRTHTRNIARNIYHISTHASAKRRTLMYLLLHCYPLFQLTSPQGDEQGARYLERRHQYISTRVSPRRRTGM